MTDNLEIFFLYPQAEWINGKLSLNYQHMSEGQEIKVN